MSAPDVNKTLGALFIGLCVCIYFTATTADQSLWYLSSTKDGPRWRAAVALIILISIAHTAVLTFTAYDYMITNFGNYNTVASSEWNLVVHFAIFTLISLIVQLYYAAKIATLFTSKKRKLALVGVIAALALAQTGFGIAGCISTWRLPDAGELLTLNLRDQLAWQMLGALSASVICDVLISGAMIKDARSPRFAARSETVLRVFSRFVIETNLLTTVTAILNLVFFFVFRSTGVSIAFSVVTPKLYLLSMLFSLNHFEERSLEGISSRTTHQSRLSDFFKGTPFRSKGLTKSVIGRPVSQLRFDQTDPLPSSPTWQKTAVTPLETGLKTDSFAISDYGGFSTSINVGSPKTLGATFGRQQQERSLTPVHQLYSKGGGGRGMSTISGYQDSTAVGHARNGYGFM